MSETNVLAEKIAVALGKIDGVLAVVLGGSVGSGTSDQHSDLDIGIYYSEKSPPSLIALNDLAEQLDDRHQKHLVTPFGEWGSWINGGGWLEVENQKVDLLYSNIDKVNRIVDDAMQGITQCHYQPGHPHGFHEHYYLGQIHYSHILFDPKNLISELKSKIKEYPKELQKSIVQKYLWEANFSLDCALKSAKRGETFYVSGSIFRSVASLIQVLFALNKRYCMNEKGALKIIKNFKLCPPDFIEVVNQVLSNLGNESVQLLDNISKIRTQITLIEKIVSIDNVLLENNVLPQMTKMAKLETDRILENENKKVELIPGTSYKLYSNIKNAYKMIDQKVTEYDKKCVPPTQNPEMIYLNYVIKENDKIIAGICADVYIWKILFIELIFVHEDYRHKKLGSLLIQKVEQEAKSLGVRLAHLDTFEFQAKDFYIKHGYEVFGTLDDCPSGHKRFYLKKNL